MKLLKTFLGCEALLKGLTGPTALSITWLMPCLPAECGLRCWCRIVQCPVTCSHIVLTGPVAACQVGLKILLDDEKVFACYNSIHDTVFHAELGSSLAILNAGYTIDTLMLKYQGADWRDRGNWACNAG